MASRPHRPRLEAEMSTPMANPHCAKGTLSRRIPNRNTHPTDAHFRLDPGACSSTANPLAASATPSTAAVPSQAGPETCLSVDDTFLAVYGFGIDLVGKFPKAAIGALQRQLTLSALPTFAVPIELRSTLAQNAVGQIKGLLRALSGTFTWDRNPKVRHRMPPL